MELFPQKLSSRKLETLRERRNVVKPHDYFLYANVQMLASIFCPWISRVEESALRAWWEKLFAYSSDLFVEFKKHDADKTGKTDQVEYT